PIKVEVELHRGIVIEGRLLDKASGKPVAGIVEYAVKPDNPAAKEFTFVRFLGSRPRVGPDGKFKILAVSGPGYLAARADENRFARAVPEGWTGSFIPAVPRELHPNYYHATVAIDPDEKKPASLKIDVQLDRGLSKSGSIYADGKPLSGVIVFGLTAI